MIWFFVLLTACAFVAVWLWGYETGLERGEREGWDHGYIAGMRRGKREHR